MILRSPDNVKADMERIVEENSLLRDVRFFKGSPMGCDREAEAVESLITLCIGSGGSTEKRERHRRSRDGSTVLAVVQDRYTSSESREIEVLVRDNFELCSLPRIVPSRRTRNLSESALE